ncbi:hypothetical protein D9M71_375450 [compost metagenome]
MLEHTAEGGEVLREIQQGAVGFGTEGDHLCVDVLANMSLQFLQARLQHGVQAVGAYFRKAKGHAQRLLAFVQVEAVEGLAEARQLVGLAQHQVDRRVGVEALGVLFHPRHQLGGQGVALIAVGGQQLGQADHHYQAIDRRLAALLAQHAQEGRELAGRLVIAQIAPGGVDHHCVGAEIPVAVLGAAFAVVGGGNAGRQAGMGQQRGLAGGRHADYQVPGQVGQRRLAAAAGGAVGAQHGDGMLEALAQHLLVTELAGGIPRAIDLDLQQVLQVVLGANALVLAQHDHQQEAGADDRQRFRHVLVQPRQQRGDQPAGQQARQPQQ